MSYGSYLYGLRIKKICFEGDFLTSYFLILNFYFILLNYQITFFPMSSQMNTSGTRL